MQVRRNPEIHLVTGLHVHQICSVVIDGEKADLEAQLRQEPANLECLGFQATETEAWKKTAYHVYRI